MWSKKMNDSWFESFFAQVMNEVCRKHKIDLKIWWRSILIHWKELNPLHWIELVGMDQSYRISWTHWNGLNPLWWVDNFIFCSALEDKRTGLLEVCTQLYVIRKHANIYIRFSIQNYTIKIQIDNRSRKRVINLGLVSGIFSSVLSNFDKKWWKC